MNSILNLILVLGLGAAVIGLIFWGGFDEVIGYLKEYGRQLITAAQIVGLFVAGALGKPRLAIVLLFTLMTTIFWE